VSRDALTPVLSHTPAPFVRLSLRRRACRPLRYPNSRYLYWAAEPCLLCSLFLLFYPAPQSVYQFKGLLLTVSVSAASACWRLAAYQGCHPLHGMLTGCNLDACQSDTACFECGSYVVGGALSVPLAATTVTHRNLLFCNVCARFNSFWLMLSMSNAQRVVEMVVPSDSKRGQDDTPEQVERDSD
jgi:hypothetical protein